MRILDKLTELSFLELRNGRIYTELGGDVTDELVAAVNAAAAEDAAAKRFHQWWFTAEKGKLLINVR